MRASICYKAKSGISMNSEFSPAEWLNLSAGERVACCQLMAHEASGLARNATNNELKWLYLQLVQDWQRLAQEIQQETQ
jgi:hypothetical protein